MSRRPADYIRMVTSSTLYHPDGTKTVEKQPAVWTLAHRGYSGGGRLDVWVYPTKPGSTASPRSWKPLGLRPPPA